LSNENKITLEQVLHDMPFKGGCYHDPRTNKIYKLGDFNPNSMSETFKAGQMIMPTDYSAMRSQVVLEEIMGFARPKYMLRNICRIIPTMILAFKTRKGTGLTAQEKVPVLEEPEISTVKIDWLPWELWKNVVLVVMPIESRYQPGANLMALDVEDSGKALAASENSQIKAVAEDVEDIAGADWGDDVNPYDDIGAAMLEIAPYPVNFVAANPLVWLDFFSNNRVKGTGQAVQTPEGLMGGIFTIPGLPGVKGISEASLTSTIALIGSTEAPAIMLADGPSESARFSNELAGYDAFVIRHWLQPQANIKEEITQGIRKLTGVHAAE